MGHIFLSFLFFNVILLIFYNHYKRGHNYIKKSNLIFYTILLIAFGTYGTGEGDYLHYKESVALFESMFDVVRYNGMEIQYNYLAFILGGNYTLWRLVIFSIQFIGMSWLLYKAKLNTYPVYLGIVAICLLLYTYQRSYWGVIFYFLGMYLLVEKKNPLFLIIIALCYVSHTQNIILLALLPLCFVNIKRWEMLLAIVLIGTIAALLKDYFTGFIDAGGIDSEEADYLNDKVSRYGEGGTNFFGSSIGEYAVFIMRYVPLALIVLSWIKMIFDNRKKYLSFDKPYRSVMNVAIGLTIASVVILVSDIGAGIFFYRVLAMVLFPVALLLPYMVEKGIIKKIAFNRYILIYIICAELNYVKDLYYAYVHGVV